jgi:heptosyltransferase III
MCQEEGKQVCVQNILLVRPGALGDTILTIPLVHTLREVRPDAQIVFLGTRRYRDLLPREVAFQDFDAPEWLWLFDRQDADVGNVARPFDLAYVMLTRSEPVVRNLLRRGTREVEHASPAPQARIPMVVHLHESLGLQVPQPRPALSSMVSGKREDIIWVHPGSGGPSKCIPLPLMTALVQRVAAKTGCRVMVTVSDEDAFLTRGPDWERLVGDPATVVLKDRPLPELCRELGSARLFLGNDSGISHLAAALGVPAAVFFLRTDPLIWAPWTDASLLYLADLRTGDMAAVNVLQLASDIIAFMRT